MIRLFHPESADQASEAGIVLINHIGSTVAEDTGRDAQYLADDFAMPVIAADRPGTTGWFPSRQVANQLADPCRYVDAMGVLGIHIDDIAASEGIERLLVLGRSAGAVGALALTVAATIERQMAVFAAEPVAIESMTVAAGRARVKSYMAIQREQLATRAELIHPEPHGLTGITAIRRAASIPHRYWLDQYHNGELWATDAVIGYGRNIAAHHLDIDTTIEFASLSLAGANMAQLRALQSLEAYRDHTNAPFMVTTSPNTVHASYDKRSFMSERIRPIVQRMISA